MLSHKKRSTYSEETSVPEKKIAKVSDEDEDDKSDEEEKELESFLFGEKSSSNVSENNVGIGKAMGKVTEDDDDDDDSDENEDDDDDDDSDDSDEEVTNEKEPELLFVLDKTPKIPTENGMESNVETIIYTDRNSDLTISALHGQQKSTKLHNNSGSEDEEKDLASFLFGNFNQNILAEDKTVILNEEREENTDLLSFEISTKPNVDFHEDNDDANNESRHPIQLGSGETKKKSVWIDPDDEAVSIDIKNKRPLRKLRVAGDEEKISGTKFQERLRTNYEKILPAPAWADINRGKSEMSDDDENEEENIFKTRKTLISRPGHLLKGLISIKKLKDLNRAQPADSTITSLKFHPSAKIAFTASLSKHLNIYQVDGRENRKLQSIFLNKFPIHSAEFTANGDKVICSSRRKFYYVYDLIAGSVDKIPEIKGRNEKSLDKFTLSPDGEVIAFLGESGYVNLVSTKSHQWIANMKMNGNIRCAAFSPDSSKLYTAGCDGEVYIWDVKSRRCMHRFVDEGSLTTTSIGISQNGQFIALGSSSGVVNVYDDRCFMEKSPAPLKAIMNLTTSIGGSVFNPSSEILACFSSQVRNALKLIHFPSLTTFSNWPIEKQTLGNISCVDFSPKSGYLGIGNESGKALLFRLGHFPDS